jgi:hypothetical protein
MPFGHENKNKQDHHEANIDLPDQFQSLDDKSEPANLSLGGIHTSTNPRSFLAGVFFKSSRQTAPVRGLQHQPRFGQGGCQAVPIFHARNWKGLLRS